jgi:hypothetical protein
LEKGKFPGFFPDHKDVVSAPEKSVRIETGRLPFQHTSAHSWPPRCARATDTSRRETGDAGAGNVETERTDSERVVSPPGPVLLRVAPLRNWEWPFGRGCGGGAWGQRPSEQNRTGEAKTLAAPTSVNAGGLTLNVSGIGAGSGSRSSSSSSGLFARAALSQHMSQRNPAQQLQQSQAGLMG